MKEDTAYRLCQMTPILRAYVVLNIVLLGLLAFSLIFIEWSLSTQPFVIAVLGLTVVLGSIAIFGGMILWCRQYTGVKTVE